MAASSGGERTSGVSAIPGLLALWEQTIGSTDVCIAVLDGPVDLSHPAFAGSSVEQLTFSTRRPTDDSATRHGTHVASVIFGQHGSCVRGLAPRCRGVIVPVFESGRGDAVVPCSQIDLARALQMAAEYGAKIINISGGEYTTSATAHPILADAVRRCARDGILIVAAAGNDGCQCVHVPGSLPSVLPVGAVDAAGKPLEFSNWGNEYRKAGVVALGQDILGAEPGGRVVSRTGTSFASPIVTGVVGLLLDLQRRANGWSDVRQVRDAIVASAQRTDCDPAKECQRLLAGRLNIRGATTLVLNRGKLMQETDRPVTDTQPTPAVLPATTVAPSPQPAEAVLRGGVTPSACGCNGGGGAGGPQLPQLIFALGKIGYDLQTEARRDTIIANMEVPPGEEQGNAYDPRQLVAYLEQNPSEAARITWTLNHDATPIYAIRPQGAFAADAYKILVGFLRDQLAEGVEVVSIAGTVVGSTRLFTGQSVPVVVPEIRGMFSWTIGKLVEGVLGPPAKKDDRADDAGGAAVPAADDNTREALDNFLRRIYFEFRNLGLTPQDRAINFAGTQIFRIARYLERQQRRGNQLDTIDVQRSPICRPESNCWDVRIIFFDPENVMRARSAFLVTIDVSDSVPVMISDGVREFSVR